MLTPKPETTTAALDLEAAIDALVTARYDLSPAEAVRLNV